MIEEAYVSFEIAKLLKAKGFDSVCNGYYNQEKVLERVSSCSVKDTFKSPFYFDCVPAPTLQMAMKWLRKEHNIVCNINIESRNFYYYSIFIIRSSIEAQYQLTSQKPYFETYEEACEAAIKYCLDNLILINMKIENNTIIVDDDDFPINEKMTKLDCYGKGMIDLSEKVKFIVDTAKTSKEQHSYMYWGNILDSLINKLEGLTGNILSFKNNNKQL